MLTALRIRNLAIIDELEVGLGPGLTMITGETGSGKSILVHALQLVLGGRARPDVVRTGEERAEVEALFEVGDDPGARARLRSMGLPEDDELVVRRVIQAGRSRATVNGRLTTAVQLRELAAGLVDISSQHEHHSLADPSTHLATLDAWAGRSDLLEALQARFAAAADARSALADLRLRLAERADRQDLLRFQLAEIERLDPRPDELDDLDEQIDRLRHAETLRKAAAGAEHSLYARDRSLCAEIAGIESELADASVHDAGLGPFVEQIASARAELEDAAEQLGRYARRLDADPDELARVEDRAHALRRLARRFGGDLTALVAHRDAARGELALLDDAEGAVERLEAAADAALREAGEAASALSQARRAAAEALGQAIGAQLSDLGMGDARIEVQVAPLQGGEGELTWQGARLTPRGIDRVELLISPNPGEEPRPLGRIASGGELSRALLATKRVLSGLGPVGTYVFDEVDTGVGGAVAESIGHKLAEVARHHQVVCITHLPQIAALGQHHLRVEKHVTEGRTRSRLVRLDDDARVEELARMLGGRTVGEAARNAARALLPPS